MMADRAGVGEEVCFGVITDVHGAIKPDQTGVDPALARHYRAAFGKLAVFAEAMNAHDAAFVIDLGDLIDQPVAVVGEGWDGRRRRALDALGQARSALSLFAGPRHHVLGNHDTDVLEKADFAALDALDPGRDPGSAPSDRQVSAASWDAGGAHFIRLDADFLADGAPFSGRPGAAGAGYTWRDAHVPAHELAWLAADLAAGVSPTVVFTHQPLNPLERQDPGFDPDHQIKEAPAIRQLLERSGRVVAVFSGHYHPGGSQWINGIPYTVLRANVIGGDDPVTCNQFAFVTLARLPGDGRERWFRVTLMGHGAQPSARFDVRLGAPALQLA